MIFNCSFTTVMWRVGRLCTLNHFISNAEDPLSPFDSISLRAIGSNLLAAPSWWEVPLHNPAVEIITQWLASTRSLKVAKILSNQPGPGAMTARKRHQIALLSVPGYQYRSQELWDPLGIPCTGGHHAGYQGRGGNCKEIFFLLCVWKCYYNNSLLLPFLHSTWQQRLWVQLLQPLHLSEDKHRDLGGQRTW